MPRLLQAAVTMLSLLIGSSDAALGAPLEPKSCAGCGDQPGCEEQRDACLAGCRAQFFAIDPHRDACLRDCAAQAAALCARPAR